jgi:acyl carrier protein
VENIEQQVKRIVAAQLGLEVADIKNDSHITHDLGADSLDKIELVMALEDDFKLDIRDEDEEKLLTVQNIIDYVSAEKANA